MNIEKSKLKLGVWYEDKEGNMYKSDSSGKPNDKCLTYHACFPLDVREEIRGIYDNKDTCNHPLRYRKRTGGWIDGIKGCKCEKCGKEKVGKKYIPFAFMKWKNGADTYPIMTGRISIGDSDCILAMANSGDYTLEEAIIIYANACERCANVLRHKYLGEKYGYEEFSEEWKKANTECEFCKN